MKTYGYCRISTKDQSIDRQIRNIVKEYPDAIIRTEAYTGTKTEGRKVFQRLLKEVKKGDVIVFDSVSRMSRNAEEGVEIYMDLNDRGVELVFLKERHIDTRSYKEAMENAGINFDTDNTAEGELISDLAKALTKFMRAKAKADIRKAFDQSEKEVLDLRQRTREGMETARLNGKQIGRVNGPTMKYDKNGNITKSYKKAEDTKAKIKKYSKSFGGALTDKDVMELLKVSRGTYYKYKREIENE